MNNVGSGDGGDDISREKLREEPSICLPHYLKSLSIKTDILKSINKLSIYEIAEIKKEVDLLLNIDIIQKIKESNCEGSLYSIFYYVGPKHMQNMELVSWQWNSIISKSQVWKYLLKKKMDESKLFVHLSIVRGWGKYLLDSDDENIFSNRFYRRLYFLVEKDAALLHRNWNLGIYTANKINNCGVNDLGVYYIQQWKDKIIGGMRDNNIGIWEISSGELIKRLSGHTGSVLSLQADDKKMITGSSDCTIKIWCMVDFILIFTILAHSSAVLNLKFVKTMLVTCSKDYTFKVWNISRLESVELVKTCKYHTNAINAIDFDEKYIVTGSGDRTAKIFKTLTLKLVHEFVGHSRGISSLSYNYPYLLTGSSDQLIKLWDVEKLCFLCSIAGNEDLVRSIAFDKNYVVSGAYDGMIKIWSFPDALKKKSITSMERFLKIKAHNGKIFKVIMNHTNIISSGQDNSIIIWNFLDSTLSDDYHWNPYLN